MRWFYPPEEVLYLEDAKIERDSWYFIGHKAHVRIDELRANGYDVPDDIQGPEIGMEGLLSEEAQTRRNDSSNTTDEIESSAVFTAAPGLRKVWCYTLYIYTDFDGDGIAEWNKITLVGDTILEEEVVDYPLMFNITPVPTPFRLTGNSMADLVVELQDLMTALNRSVLDYVYSANNPRTEIAMQGANEHTIADYLDNSIGGYVRTKVPGTLTPMYSKPLEPWTFNLLEHWQGKIENRAGVTRYNQGLQADSLNKTAHGMMQIMNASMQRIELIARIFAETGVKQKIRAILDLSIKYPEYVGERVLRLTGKSLEISSDNIKGKYDLIVNPSVGTGNKEQTMQGLMLLLQTYERLIAGGLGPGSEKQMVTTRNIFNTVREMIKNMGFKNAKDFITDPKDDKAERDPVTPPQPSPEQIKAQVEQQKIQIQQKKDELDAQVEQAKVANEQQKIRLDAEIERGKYHLEMEKLKLAEKELQLKKSVEEHNLNHESRKLSIQEHLAAKEIRATDEESKRKAETHAMEKKGRSIDYISKVTELKRGK